MTELFDMDHKDLLDCMLKHTPILAYCEHAADPTYLDGVGGKMTCYAAHAEGFGHAEDGWHIVVWGGGFDDSTYEDPQACWMPDWWFVADGNFETPANPVKWCRLPFNGDKPCP